MPPVNRSLLNRLDESWKECTGKGVSVAIIDSGIDTTHPDLEGKVRSSYEASKEGPRVVFNETDSGDSAGHGTACAGIVAGIAPDAEIHSIKVLGSAGIGDGDSFLAGLEFAVKLECKIINLSLGTTKPHYSAPLRDLLDRAYLAGSIVVSAANNLPQPSFPSVFSSSLISVSKHAETDPYKFGFRFGEVIEMTAPGVNVKTAWPGGSHKTITGNSFACPHISAVLSQLLERYPDLTPFEAKSALFAISNSSRSG
ncbi:MAG: serine protease [Acidobacteria bacterium]|nr:MAG: serine protease [Acidobacteriota bacterium]REK01564.1 MAG: serine protease [Acidobacteriota bacterium]REK14520.1 MAG: serine protease [Acidobacteriota bacterium]REK45235.1 MAG: serine protease [Acidobacteriota bacterium]